MIALTVRNRVRTRRHTAAKRSLTEACSGPYRWIIALNWNRHGCITHGWGSEEWNWLRTATKKLASDAQLCYKFASFIPSARSIRLKCSAVIVKTINSISSKSPTLKRLQNFWFRQFKKSQLQICKIEKKINLKSILGLVATALGVLLILEIIEHLSHRLVWPVLVPGYVRGNCKSRIYHRAGCEFGDMTWRVRFFRSRRSALDSGYRPCYACRPRLKIAST